MLLACPNCNTVFRIEKTNPYQILGVIFSLLGVAVIVTKADLGKLLNSPTPHTKKN